MSNVVRILLVEFDVGQHLLQSDRARIKSDLMLALEMISHDLEHATMEEGICCRTLPVLMDVFDETIYYESNELISKFRQTGGFLHLGKYLVKTASTEFFPGLDQVSAILTLVGKVLGEEIDKKEHMTTCESVLDISNGIIENMKHFKQEKLARLSDDVMDICRRVCAIYADVGGIGMTSIVNVYCDFVLSMVQSPSAQLKDFGWVQLCNIIKRFLKDRRPPRAYLVEGSGDDFVNGEYELGNIKNKKYDVYTRKVGKHKSFTLSRNCGCWSISGTHRMHESSEEDYYIHYSMHNTPPCTGWQTSFYAFDPPPIVIPVDFDDIISPTENNLLKWMLQSNLLEVFANDADSGIWETIRVKWEAKRSIFYSIEQLLSLLLQTLSSRNYQHEADSYLELVKTEKLIMRALLRLSPDSMKKIGMHFISGIFKQLKEVIRRNTDQRHRKVDFQIFCTLLTMRGLKDEQDEKMIFGGDQDDECYEDDLLLAQAYFLAGAGSSDGNGLYVLDKYRTMDDYDLTYTQMYIDHDGKESALLKMHLCLDGPDKGCWIISDANEEYHYVNRSMTVIPPCSGWTGVGDNHYLPDLVPIGVALRESDTFESAPLQREVLHIVQRLFALYSTPEPKKSSSMKQAVHSDLQLLLDKTELCQLYRTFCLSAREILEQIFEHVNCKRQLSMGQFVVKTQRLAQSSSLSFKL